MHPIAFLKNFGPNWVEVEVPPQERGYAVDVQIVISAQNFKRDPLGLDSLSSDWFRLKDNRVKIEVPASFITKMFDPDAKIEVALSIGRGRVGGLSIPEYLREKGERLESSSKVQEASAQTYKPGKRFFLPLGSIGTDPDSQKSCPPKPPSPTKAQKGLLKKRLELSDYDGRSNCAFGKDESGTNWAEAWNADDSYRITIIRRKKELTVTVVHQSLPLCFFGERFAISTSKNGVIGVDKLPTLGFGETSHGQVALFTPKPCTLLLTCASEEGAEEAAGKLVDLTMNAKTVNDT